MKNVFRNMRIFTKIFSAALLLLIMGVVQLSAKVMLGIDVLESMNFAPIAGKRVGLLTHPAGVNMNGESTIDVLRRARNVRLKALYGPEHGIYGDEKANVKIGNRIDKRTGLPVYSLYGKYRKPTPDMLSGIDVLVIDLQDVGCRSYTYVSCMLRAMEACFELGKQVVVLDRPNPLGGVKIDGPWLDDSVKSYVGMFKVPYVHGMTIGELAKFAKGTPGAMEITSKAQKSGKLLVIPMRGWRRDMLWPFTGLRWVPTSPAIPTYQAAYGYAMTGLGCQLGGFQHGYGTQYPFRLLTCKGKTPDQIIYALRRYNIKGLAFRKLSGKNAKGATVDGVYVYITDFSALKPTRLSMYMTILACEFSGKNPFSAATQNEQLLFDKHFGARTWLAELKKRGRFANVEAFGAKCDAYCARFAVERKPFLIY